MSSFLRSTLLAGTACLTGLALCELATRAVMPTATRHYVRRPGTVQVMTPDPSHVAGVGTVAHFVVNRDGIRGAPFAPNQYRILAIGGSTTELLYNDAPVAWPALVASELDTLEGRAVWVGNVGRSGNAMHEHLLQFTHLTAEYPAINAVTLLAGINDAALAMADCAPERSQDEQLARAFEIYPGADATLPAYKRLALYRLARGLRARSAPHGPAQNTSGAWLDDARAHRRAGVQIDTMPVVDRYLAAYQRDLRAIVRMAQQRGIQLVLLTQPSLLRADNTPAEVASLWFGAAEVDGTNGKAATRYYTPRIVARVLDAFNAVTRATCRETGVPCVDLAREIPATSAMFYDDVHFTDAGSRAVAAAVSQRFRAAWP